MAMQPTRRVLVTGASGLLGRALVRRFEASPSWEVIGLAKSRATNGLIKVDLLDATALEKVILETKPAVIVHAAAERNCNTVDANYDAAYELNVNVSRRIAELAGQIGAVHVYISTDYVFDGTTPPYRETDTPNPLNKYGVTKLEGEKATLGSNPGACVFRVPVLYGQVEYLDESVVTGLLANLLDDGKTSVVSDYEIRYPTNVDDVAEVCHRLASEATRKPNSVAGIYHFSGRDAMTKYEMVRVMSDVLKLPMKHIVRDPLPTKGAPRPYDSHLDTAKLDGVVGEVHASFGDAIKKCLAKFVPVN